MSDTLQTMSENDIDKQHIIELFNAGVKGAEICLDGQNIKTLWKRGTLVGKKNGYKA